MPIDIEKGTYCTAEEAAQVAGLTVGALKLLLRQGKVPGVYKISDRCWLVPLAGAELLKGRKVGRPGKKAPPPLSEEKIEALKDRIRAAEKEMGEKQ